MFQAQSFGKELKVESNPLKKRKIPKLTLALRHLPLLYVNSLKLTSVLIAMCAVRFVWWIVRVWWFAHVNNFTRAITLARNVCLVCWWWKQLRFSHWVLQAVINDFLFDSLFLAACRPVFQIARCFGSRCITTLEIINTVANPPVSTLTAPARFKSGSLHHLSRNRTTPKFYIYFTLTNPSQVTFPKWMFTLLSLTRCLEAG